MSSYPIEAGTSTYARHIKRSEGWHILRNHLEFHLGFALVIVLFPDIGMAPTFRKLLSSHLATSNRQLVDASPASSADVLELNLSLSLLRVPEDAGVVWVEVPVSEFDRSFVDWSTAARQGFGQLNSSRNLLQKELPCTLLLCGAPWIQAILRTMAPDLWSIRSVVVTMEPLLPSRLRGNERSGSGQSTANTPNPLLALDRAERMRGEKGQEEALARTLYRAGVGFLGRGELQSAQKALRDALQVCETFGMPQSEVMRVKLALARALRDSGASSEEVQELFASVVSYFQGTQDTLSLSDALSEYAQYQLSVGRLQQANLLLQRALDLSRDLKDDLRYTRYADQLASVLLKQGELAGAKELELEALATRRRTQGEDHPDTLTSMSNLASTLSMQGDFSGARKLQEQVLEVRGRILGAEHPDTLTAMNNLATTLYDQGQFSSARRLEEDCLGGRRRTLGDEHPDTLTSMNNLASMLSSLGELTEARKLHEQVLDVRRRTLGEEHTSTLTSMNNLAGSLTDEGEITGALNLEKRVLEARRRIQGEEHPLTLTSGNNLASTLFDQGDFAGARELQEQILKTAEHTLGRAHPMTLTLMNNLAVTLSSQQDVIAAQNLHHEIMETRKRTLGEEHPDTLASVHNVARGLCDLGDLTTAREMQEEIVGRSQRTLGQEHPKTLSFMNALADIMFDQGDLPGARRLRERVLDSRRRTLGDGHQDTLLAVNNLASTLFAMGDSTPAIRLEEDLLKVLRPILGDDHPKVLLVMDNLARMRSQQVDS